MKLWESSDYCYKETHSYNRIGGGKGGIVERAKLSKEAFALKDGSTANARRGGTQEIKVQHDTLPEKQQRKLKALEEERKRIKDQKKAIENEYKNNGGTIDGKAYQRIEDAPEWKNTHGDMIKNAEKLGERAADAAMNQQLLNAKPLKGNIPGDGKQGQFDRIYQDGDKVYIVEAKGAGGQRGTLTSKKDGIVQQGSEKYRDEIIANMRKKAEIAEDFELLDTVEVLEKSRKNGNLEYLEVIQKTDGNKLAPHIQISKYE